MDLSKSQEVPVEQTQQNIGEENKTEVSAEEVKEEINTTNEWTCECGTKNSGNFCQNYGEKDE